MRVGLAVAAVPELSTALLDLGRVERLHAPELLGEREVDGGLLVRRIEIEEHDLFGRQPREDRLADDALVGRRVEPREVPVEPLAAGTHARELLALRDLEGVERREGLELDQLRGEPPAGVARDREVGDGEDRKLVATRDVERLRHGGERPVERRRRRELAEDLERRLDHLVAELRRQEDRRLGQAKRDLRSPALREPPGVLAVPRVGVGRVVRAP